VCASKCQRYWDYVAELESKKVAKDSDLDEEELAALMSGQIIESVVEIEEEVTGEDG
jgi:hypothetical protein